MHDTSTFLHISEQLWPHSPGSETDQRNRQHAKKLRGEFSWPFSIHLPGQIKVYSMATGTEEAYLLPPAFSGRWDRVTINYRIQACIGRGRLRGDRLSVLYLLDLAPRSIDQVQQTQAGHSFCVHPNYAASPSIYCATAGLSRELSPNWP